MNKEQRRKIDALYREMYDRLIIYALNLEESESLAEEAVQETFQVACREAEKCCSSPNPQGWLVNTLRNVIKNAKKKRANMRRFMERYLSMQVKEAVVSEDRIDLKVLYQNVAEMEEFKLLSEMVIEGRSHEEMARSRGISVNTCKKRVQRAKETLQRKLGFDVTL